MTWGPYISCICPLGRYHSLTLRRLQNSSWTLKPETSVSSTSADTHTSPFVYPVICGRDQHIHRAINSASAYWVWWIAGHAVCSHFPLRQTSTVIPVCKVKRYFNIRRSQLDSVLIVHTCSSVNNWELMFPRGREGITFTQPHDSSDAAHVCWKRRNRWIKQHLLFMLIYLFVMIDRKYRNCPRVLLFYLILTCLKNNSCVKIPGESPEGQAYMFVFRATFAFPHNFVFPCDTAFLLGSSAITLFSNE